MRFGLLGTGDWAERTHAAALAAAPDAELVAIWGRNPAKAEAMAGRLGVPSAPEVDALLDQVEAVAIALPPDIQAPLAARAARAGRHLLLDKPLALDLPAADDVVAAVEDAGVASVVFFTNRFKPAVAEFVRDAVETGGWDGARATMLASLPADVWASSAWRREHGGLWDVGPHALSLILPVLGPVTEVAAAQGQHGITTVLLSHAGGAVSTMTLSLRAPAASTTWDVALHGEAGWWSAPTGGDALAACIAAIGELATGRTDSPCGVRFARDVVAILAEADSARQD